MLIAGARFLVLCRQTFLAGDLAFIYPRWIVNATVWWQYLFPMAALLLLACAWNIRQRWRGLLAGLLFFAGTLFPALGFFNVFPFRYSFVADHFQYLACIGPISLAAFGITTALAPFEKNSRFLKPMACGLLIMTLAVLTWRQCRMFVDNETLWRATVAMNPDSWMAHDNLGVALSQNGKN